MFNADSQLIEKWSPVLDHESAPAIDDRYRKAVTARPNTIVAAIGIKNCA